MPTVRLVLSEMSGIRERWNSGENRVTVIADYSLIAEVTSQLYKSASTRLQSHLEAKTFRSPSIRA